MTNRRCLALVSLASLGWAVSFGLGAPLASLWLHDAGLDARTIGLNTSLYYLGIAVASPFIPWLMRRWCRSCVLTGMFLDAAVTALFPLCHGTALWMLLRLVGGVGTALSLIPMETLVNHNAPPEHRAGNFGVYAFCVALGITLGTVLGLPLYPHVPRLAFALGGLITLASLVPAWYALPATWFVEPVLQSAPVPRRAGLFAFATAWAQGFLEGGTITFLSLYLLSRGHDEGRTSGLMGCLFLGVVLAQLPLAWLADRVGRRRILIACHLLILLGSALVSWSNPLWLVAGCLFLLGACCGAMYPLGLALLGERVPASGLAKANAWYLACNCAGSLSGPLVIGLAINRFGLAAQFAVGSVAVVGVLLTGLVGENGKDRQEQKTELKRAA